MILLLSLINYRYLNKIDSSTNIAALPDFGFEKDARFEVQLQDKTSDAYAYILLTKSEYKRFKKESVNSCSQITNSTYLSYLSSKEMEASGKIQEKGVYTPIIMACDAAKVKVKLLEIYHNTDSYQDYRWNGVLIAKPITLLIFVFILVFWFINWFLHFHVQIWIHYFLTACFVLSVIDDSIRLFELSVLHKSDYDKGLTGLRIFFNVVFQACLYGTFLLIAKGWCIIRDSLPLKEIVLSMTYSVVYIATNSVIQYAEVGKAIIFFFIVSIIAAILFIRELIISVNKATMCVYAHLLVISNAGIDPKTTPIYRKLNMYHTFTFIFIGAISAMLVYLIVYIFVEIPFVVEETLTDILEIFVVTALCWIFRLQGKSPTGYDMIQPDEDENPGELSLAEIESIPDLNTPLNRGGRVWQEGMPLPAPPYLVRQPAPQIQTVANEIVLDSPDGQNTLRVRIQNEAEENSQIEKYQEQHNL